MELTHHPLQRVGARAAAQLAGRPGPGDLTEGDLAALVERITTACLVAARTGPGDPGAAWASALGAMYPNAPATHPGRSRWSDRQLAGRVREQFAPGAPVGPCVMCGQPAGARWGKALLPLAASHTHLNVRSGTPAVCRRCRVALWTLPWGCAHTPGQVHTASSEEDSSLEDALVAGNVAAAQELTAAAEPPPEPPYDRWLDTLAGRPAQLEVRRWRADNRTPWMREDVVTTGTARWLAGIRQDPGAWETLRQVGHGRATHPLRLVAGTGDDPGLRLAPAVADLARRWLDEHDGAPPGGLGPLAPMLRLAMSAAEAPPGG